MKAVMYTEYGSPEVLHVKDIAQPVPKDDQILVKIHAVHINFGDLLARNFKAVTPRSFSMPAVFWLPARLAFGFNRPRKGILGSEYAGEVVSAGKDVRHFKVGDSVFGYRAQNMGANVEYLCVSEKEVVAHKPQNMSYEEAAALPYGAITAMGLLKNAHIQPGQRVLINGASGGIGSAALQLAKQAGAHVTAVCGTPRVGFVKALGADKVIDYTKQDFTQNGETYDLIFDVLGKSSFGRCKRSLTPNGRYLLASFKMKQVLQMLWTSRFSSKKVICAMAAESQAALLEVKALAEAGTLKSIIDRRYPLERAADAHRYVEAGGRTGCVVLTMA